MNMRPDPEFFVSDPPVDPGPFFESIDRAVNGMRALSIVLASQELGIFNICRTPTPIPDLARSTGTDATLLSYLCDALASAGLVRKNGETIENTPAASLYLTDDSPYTQVHYIRELGRHFKDLWVLLPDIIRNGPVRYEQGQFYRDHSLPAMADNAVSGRLQATVRAISSLPGFSGFTKMIDLGGGHGLYAIALAALNPALEARVFDLPLVIPATEAYITRYGADRVHAVPGNFFSDDFGKGYDLILSSSNPSGKSLELLPVIAAALNDGGYFVNVQSPGGVSKNPLQVLEWELWTFSGVDKAKGGFTKERQFMTEEYRSAMEAQGLSIVVSDEVRDVYQKDARVRLVIARKEPRPDKPSL
jgi:hypothetical protein